LKHCHRLGGQIEEPLDLFGSFGSEWMLTEQRRCGPRLVEAKFASDVAEL
jgi:hypothetical protein